MVAAAVAVEEGVDEEVAGVNVNVESGVAVNVENQGTQIL